jgi:hypothetical protein
VRVGIGFGVARTDGRVVLEFGAGSLVRRWVPRGRLVLVVEGVLVLAAGAAAGSASASSAGDGAVVGAGVDVGTGTAASCTAGPPAPQATSSTPPAAVTSSARTAIGAPIGVIPVLSR